MPNVFQRKFSSITVGGIDTKILTMNVQQILTLYYVAERGKNAEEGAVQRFLNSGRINSIKEFILQGNMFFSPFILNWTYDVDPVVTNDTITIPLSPNSAQVLDGQHRLEGLKKAVQINPDINNFEVVVLMCNGLSSKEAAKIFLNINSEQKPVPKSLIYDLFKLTNDERNSPIDRATDLADLLNSSELSPYQNMIKYPGPIRRSGMQLDLSAIVNALKPYVGHSNGVLERNKVVGLQTQHSVLINFFTAIKNSYDKEGKWFNGTHNPFLKSSGFSGAIDHLMGTLVPKCIEKKSFKVDVFEELLNLDNNLLDFNDIKSLDGKSAKKRVNEYLNSLVTQNLSEQDFAF